MTAARGGMAPEVGGLGKKVERQKPAKPEWVPTETKGVERNTKDGTLRTAIPVNEAARYPFIFIPVGEAVEL